jgi:hypothetical protein
LPAPEYGCTSAPQRLGLLIDWIVEELVRELREEAQADAKAPRSLAGLAGREDEHTEDHDDRRIIPPA